MGWTRDRVNEEAREKGRKARVAGAPISDNPFKHDRGRDDEKYHWDSGYMAQEYEEIRREKQAGGTG